MLKFDDSPGKKTSFWAGFMEKEAEMLKFVDFADKNVVLDGPSGTDRRNARVY